MKFKPKLYIIVLTILSVTVLNQILYIMFFKEDSIHINVKHPILLSSKTKDILITKKYSSRSNLTSSICLNNNNNLPETYLKFEIENAWDRFIEIKENRDEPSVYLKLPPLTLDLFQPINAWGFKRKRKTVVLGIGVHIGVASDQMKNCPCADMEYISWDFRHKDFKGDRPLLSSGYNKKHLRKTQEAFFNMSKYDIQFQRADIIVCGFDAWHCLIFAPFNKMMIINNAYRFDGHRVTDGIHVIEFQKEMYKALRYNPDIILAGSIIYDVMYAQHYLGTHKIIPLPATCEYVHDRMRKELNDGRCLGVPNDSTGYHPYRKIITIFPKRLSEGGDLVAQEILDHSKNRSTNYSFNKFGNIRGRYNYCDLGKFSAAIILGYSVMSSFTCEVASLSIPMFVPTPRLYAEWEIDHHLVNERKLSLKHATFNDLVENVRSLHKGYNANDDFDEKALQYWLVYADYYYYKGTVLFDNYDELFQQIKNANLEQMNKDLFQHRVRNTVRNHLNWKAIEKYFFRGESDTTKELVMPKTLDEGIENWKMKISKPSFESNSNETKSKDETENIEFVIIDLNEYMETFNKPPKCKKKSKRQHVAYFNFLTHHSISSSDCEFVNIIDLKKISNIQHILEKYSITYSDKYIQLLIMLIYAIKNGASTIVRLSWKENSVDATCGISSDYESFLLNTNGWSQTVYSKEHFWYAWIPIYDKAVVRMWLEKVSEYTTGTSLLDCINYKQSSQEFTKLDLERLKDYLKHWESDEFINFYGLLDQLNFELAVRGYTTKYYSELHRLWLESLVLYNASPNPLIKLKQTMTE